MILLIKTIHIISAIIWLAALFALGKTMLAHSKMLSEKNDSDEGNKHFISLESSIYKLYANPAMMISFLAGITMLVMNMAYMKEGWIHIKLLFLVLLLVQHMMMKGQMKKIGTEKPVSMNMLKHNILILVVFTSAIVFMAVYKTGLDWTLFGGLLIVEIIVGKLMISRSN